MVAFSVAFAIFGLTWIKIAFRLSSMEPINGVSNPLVELVVQIALVLFGLLYVGMACLAAVGSLNMIWYAGTGRSLLSPRQNHAKPQAIEASAQSSGDSRPAAESRYRL